MDTDAVVAAMRSPRGASAALIMAADQERVTLMATVPLFIEYESVCQRPEHILASGLSAREVGVFLDRMADLVEPANLWFLWRPQLRDPGDELVLEAAVNAQADALITFNRRDFLPSAALFNIPVVLPGEALRSLR